MSPTPNNTAPTLYTDKQAADLLGVTVITLWRWRKAGLIRCRKQGRWIRFTPADIQEFIDRSLRDANEDIRRSPATNRDSR